MKHGNHLSRTLSVLVVFWLGQSTNHLQAFQIESENAIRWLVNANQVQTAEYEFEVSVVEKSDLDIPINFESIDFSQPNRRGKSWFDRRRGERIDFEWVATGEAKSISYDGSTFYSIDFKYRGMTVGMKPTMGHGLFPRLSSFYGEVVIGQIQFGAHLFDILDERQFRGTVKDIENGFLIEKFLAKSDDQDFYANLEVYIDPSSANIDHVLYCVNGQYNTTTKPAPAHAFQGSTDGYFVFHGQYFRNIQTADGVKYAADIYRIQEAGKKGWVVWRYRIDPRTVKINQPLSKPLELTRPDGFAYVNQFTGEVFKDELGIADKLLSGNSHELDSELSAIKNATPPESTASSISNPRRKNWSAFAKTSLVIGAVVTMAGLIFVLRGRFAVLLPLILFVQIGCSKSESITRNTSPLIADFKFPVVVPFDDNDQSFTKEFRLDFRRADDRDFVLNSELITTTCGCTAASWFQEDERVQLVLEVQPPNGASVKQVHVSAPILDRKGELIYEIGIPVTLAFDRDWSLFHDGEVIVQAKYGENIQHTLRIVQELTLPPPEIVFPNGEFEVVSQQRLDDYEQYWDVSLKSTGKAGIDLAGRRTLEIVNLVDSQKPIRQPWTFQVESPGSWVPPAIVLKADEAKSVSLNVMPGWIVDDVRPRGEDLNVENQERSDSESRFEVSYSRTSDQDDSENQITELLARMRNNDGIEAEVSLRVLLVN